MADTVFTTFVFWQKPHGDLRYVLKQELQLLPCLDIGGNLLPNVFVDRSGADSDAAVRDVSDLVASAGKDESVLIYPEGTRFTQKKHDDLATRRPQLQEQLSRWPGPPTTAIRRRICHVRKKILVKIWFSLLTWDLRVQLASTISSAAAG